MAHPKTLTLFAAGLLLQVLPAYSSKPFQTKLSKEKQALHVVDRLTFGGKLRCLGGAFQDLPSPAGGGADRTRQDADARGSATEAGD